MLTSMMTLYHIKATPKSTSYSPPIARQQYYNVVLVDTAGRMQDNEPLMRALAKLIRVNQPDLVLFVGEALVGNEAVDQLEKFNRALVDHSEEGNTRTIDGILLTKFDTIDDKVCQSACRATVQVWGASKSCQIFSHFNMPTLHWVLNQLFFLE